MKGILLRHILWKLGIQKFCQVPWQTPSPLKVHRVYSIYLLLIFAKFQKTRDGRERFFERAGNGSKSAGRGGAHTAFISWLKSFCYRRWNLDLGEVSQIYSTFIIMMVNGYYDVNHFSVLSYFFSLWLSWIGKVRVCPFILPCNCPVVLTIFAGNPPCPGGRGVFPCRKHCAINFKTFLSDVFCRFSNRWPIAKVLNIFKVYKYSFLSKSQT